LNIHYYENAILERVRLNEMMEYGIKIISEKPCKEDMDICKNYKSIHFIEIINHYDNHSNNYSKDKDNNLYELINTINYMKNNKEFILSHEYHNRDDLKELEIIFKKNIQCLKIQATLFNGCA
jgi:hypothetical protein